MSHASGTKSAVPCNLLPLSIHHEVVLIRLHGTYSSIGHKGAMELILTTFYGLRNWNMRAFHLVSEPGREVVNTYASGSALPIDILFSVQETCLVSQYLVHCSSVSADRADVSGPVKNLGLYFQS